MSWLANSYTEINRRNRDEVVKEDTSSSHLPNACSATIQSYQGTQKGDLWTDFALIIIAALPVIHVLCNLCAYMNVIMSNGHMITICYLPCQLPTQYRSLQEVTSCSHITLCLMIMSDLVNDHSQSWCHKSACSCDISLCDCIT